MNRSFIFTFSLIILSSFQFVGLAQTTNRIEIEMKQGMRQPLVVPSKGIGLVVIERNSVNLLDPSEQIILTGYDTALTQLWRKPVEYNKRLNFVQYEAFGPYAYLIFNSEANQNIEVIKVDIISGDVQSFSFSYFNRFIIKDFCARNNKVYIGGLLKLLPIALELNLETGKLTGLPLPIDGKKVNMQDIYFSKHGEVVVSLAFEKERRKVVLIKTYHPNGTSDDLLIEPEEEYALLNGKMTRLGTKSGIAIGTYSYRNSESTQGFYIGGYYENKEVFKKYHNFSELNNFFNFLNEKSQDRMEDKIKRKKEQGKDLKTKYRLLVHDVMERKNDYIMLAEAYYPTYRTERIRRYTARGYYYDNVTVFDGFQYTHAVVVAFSKKGEIVWDHSFKINDTKLYYLRERVTMDLSEDKLTLLYSHEGKIHSMVVKNDEVIASKNEIALNTGYEGDRVRQSSLGDSEYWFGRNFLAWGQQKIKNLEGETDSKRRNVFYINKLSL